MKDRPHRWTPPLGRLATALAGLTLGLCGRADAQTTALDDYVAAPDASYTWNIREDLTHDGDGFTEYIVEMTSQTWRDPADNEMDDNVWDHHLYVYVPDTVNPSYDTSLLMIGGGGGLMTEPNPYHSQLAVDTQSIVSLVMGVPKAGVTFAGEAGPRSEDPLLAKTFRNYLDSVGPAPDTWPALLPMVNSAVRAMDTVEFVVDQETAATVDHFVVTGHSKRGWTTFLTGAVDDRVVGIAPLSFDALNMAEQVPHHRKAYLNVTEELSGGYSNVIAPYTAEDVFVDWTPELSAMIDPYEYRDRMTTMPKYLCNAAMDAFFVSDSGQFYLDDMDDETYVSYGRRGHGGLPSAGKAFAFYTAILNDYDLPDYSWQILADGTIVVTTSAADTLTGVKLWYVTNPDSRDFRNTAGGQGLTWIEQLLADPEADGIYAANVAVPATGATAYMIELTYDVDGQSMIFTTEVHVATLGDLTFVGREPGQARYGIGDGVVDIHDIEYFLEHYSSGGDRLDVDGDSDVDADDLAFLVEGLVGWDNGTDDGRGVGSFLGDFNLDGLINATDLAIVKSSFGLSGIGYAAGNANTDSIVDATDLAILAANFGYVAPTGAVPEPVALGLLAVGGLALLRRRR